MNFSEMGVSVARLLRQAPGSNGLYTCADLSAVINDANLDVCKDTNALKSSYEVYTVPGTYQYALSAASTSGVLSLWHVYWNNMPLTQVNFNDFRWGTNAPKVQSTPKVYRVWNNKIELDPTPDDSQPLDIYFTTKPALLSLSDATTELPSEFHMAVVYKACSYLTIKDEKEMRYNAFFAKYQYELSRLRALMTGFDGSAAIPLDPYNATSLNNWNSQY